jgi:MYXO-CTERM domain-containing protein
MAYNGLTHSVRGRLKFRLPRRPEGWKFLDSWGHVEAPLYDVAPDALGGAATFYVGVEITAPAAAQGFPVKPGWQRKRLFEAVPATGNKPPEAALDVTVAGQAGGAAAASQGSLAVVFVGQTATLSTASSKDPDGDAIIASFITTPEGDEVRATEIRRTFSAVGRFKFKAEVLDARGAAGRVEREVAVIVPPPPLQPGGPASQPAALPPGTQPGSLPVKPHGCGCRVGAAGGPGLAALVLLVLAFGRRRRRAL